MPKVSLSERFEASMNSMDEYKYLVDFISSTAKKEFGIDLKLKFVTPISNPEDFMGTIGLVKPHNPEAIYLNMTNIELLKFSKERISYTILHEGGHLIDLFLYKSSKIYRYKRKQVVEGIRKYLISKGVKSKYLLDPFEIMARLFEVFLVEKFQGDSFSFKKVCSLRGGNSRRYCYAVNYKLYVSYLIN